MAIKRKRYTLHQTDEPEFVGMIPNLTISVGRDAKFPCIVNNLDTYRVSYHHFVNNSCCCCCFFGPGV